MLPSTRIGDRFFSLGALVDVFVSGRPSGSDRFRKAFLVRQSTIGLHGCFPGMQPVAARHSAEIQESGGCNDFGKRRGTIDLAFAWRRASACQVPYGAENTYE